MAALRTVALTVAPLALLLAACGSSGGAGATATTTTTTVSVTSTDTACTLSTKTLTAGKTLFGVRNSGGDVTEVYVYAKSAGGAFDKVVGEVENIAPSTARDFPVTLTNGEYEVACKPGQAGEGIRTLITVTGGDSAAATETSYDREIGLTVTDAGLTGLDGFAAKVGEKIEFTLTNSAAAPFEVTILDPAGKQVGEVPRTAPGAQGSTVVEFSAPGTYTAVPVNQDTSTRGVKASFTVS